MTDPTAAAPAALLAVVFGLIELVKYVSRRRANGNGRGLNGLTGPMTEILAGCKEGNRRLELILVELKADREEHLRDRLEAARTDERNKLQWARLDRHMTDMECVKRARELRKPGG